MSIQVTKDILRGIVREEVRKEMYGSKLVTNDAEILEKANGIVIETKE